MLEKIISKYTLKEILEGVGSAIAIADNELKILWFNDNFKKLIDEKRIKGRNAAALFETEQTNLVSKPPLFRQTRLNVKGKQLLISVNPLTSDNKTDAFLIKAEKPADITDQSQTKVQPAQDIPSLQKELTHILSVLLNKNSIENVVPEILSACVRLYNMKFGIAIVYDSDNRTRIFIEDAEKLIPSIPAFEKEIITNFNYINKWLTINKRILLTTNDETNIGFGLTTLLKSEFLLVAPALNQDQLIAAIILSSRNNEKNVSAYDDISLFTTLLSFAVTNIRIKEINNTLESSLLQAQKLETIGKLTSGMAHDFSNLLSNIFGSLNLLKKKVPNEEPILRLLENIESCSVRAKDLIQGVLTFGKPTPKREELIKPNFLLMEISKVIAQTFPSRMKFELEANDKLFDILGNGTEIYQVLLNLCVNAKEAMDGSGKLKITGKNLVIDDKLIINYPYLNKGSYVTISVQDTGSGIAEENLRNIFTPYFSTKDRASGSGSGLGLYVTHNIVKSHSGHIEVTSKLNEGTTFTVFLQAYEPISAEKEIVGERIILLADDEIMLRDLLGELLESNGYNVIKVGTGVEALKVLIEEIKVDLAIIDYNMPEMNGIDCIKKIRELDYNIPLILSSGSLGITDTLDLEAMGITAALPKPYEFDTLLRKIKNLL